MIGFRQFIIEMRFLERIHHNPSSAAVKNITKHASETRYVITKDNTLKLGSAHHFTHDDLHQPRSDTKHYGLITHKEGKFHYENYSSSDEEDHPHLKRLRTAGVGLKPEPSSKNWSDLKTFTGKSK